MSSGADEIPAADFVAEMRLEGCGLVGGKAIAAGHRAGLEISAQHAIQWLTLNAARALGIESRTGSLENGKMADVVVWNRDPFSVYALAERVYVDGTLRYERGASGPPRSDFLLGQPALTEVRP